MRKKPDAPEKNTLEIFFTELSVLGMPEVFTGVFAVSRPRRGKGNTVPATAEKGAFGDFYRDLHKVRIRGIDFA